MKSIFNRIVAKTFITAALLLGTNVSQANEVELDMHVYNPQEHATFAVTSTLITGPTEAILFDAQFERSNAIDLINMVKAYGKKLTTIYISHADPDYYFGLDVIKEAFPDARVVATPATLKKMKSNMKPKLAYWGPKMGDEAPKELIVPEALKSDTLKVDGVPIKIIGFNGHDPLHTFAWIPTEKTVVGGVVLLENMHLWMADNQTTESRESWLKTLDNIEALKPERIIAGHFRGATKADTSIIDFSRKYVKDFEAANAKAANAEELIKAMLDIYPNLAEENTLEFSAKVVKGDIKWPQ